MNSIYILDYLLYPPQLQIMCPGEHIIIYKVLSKKHLLYNKEIIYNGLFMIAN